MLVAAVTIGLGLWFGVGQLLADNEAGQNKAPAGESTTSPLDVPRLRLDNPPGNLSVAVGETVTIQVTAFDTAGKGVTRVEMRRTGSVLQVVASSNPAGQAVLPAQFVYTPASVGQHQLELIAYRGSLPSDSRFITINAR
jgi:predicted RNA-binding protein with TRAM domain